MCVYFNLLPPPNLEFARTPIVVSVVVYTFHGHISSFRGHIFFFLPNLLIPGHSFVKKLDRVWWASLTHMQRRISILVAHALTLEEYSFRFVGVCHAIPGGISWPHSLSFL